MRKLVLLGAGLLSACNLAPPYRQPPLPIAPVYGHAYDAKAVSSPLATELGWREFFTDPRLQALIEAALDRNRDLAQSYARIEQARGQYRISTSARLPAIEANTGATRSRQPTSALIPGGIAGGSGATPDAVEFSQYQANVGVSAFEIDLWGRVRNLAEADRQRFLASVEGARAFRLSLIAQVAAAYFDIRAGEQRAELAERSIDGRREGVRIARLRLDAGVTSTVDYDQTMLLLTQAQADAAEIRRQTEQARNLLDVLVGGPMATPLPAARSLQQQLRPIAVGIPSDLLASRPDIQQAEHNLRAANADIGAAKAAFFPTISLTGSFGFVSTALGDLFKDGSQAWSVGGAANLPIFDWGKRSAQLRVSRAKADELAAAYQKAVQTGFKEVNDALVGRRRYAEQIEALSQTVETQQRLARTARLRYDNGIAIYLEVLDAERNLFSAAQQLNQLRSVELQNAVSLYVALGGDARIAARAEVVPKPEKQ